MLVDEAGDGMMEGVEATMDAAPDLAVGQESEEAFDLVEPGGVGGVKCMWKRGWACSHRVMTGEVWVL